MSDDGWRPSLVALTLATGKPLKDLCSSCLRWRDEHTGPFLACPDRKGPLPGEQMWLDDSTAPGVFAVRDGREQ